MTPDARAISALVAAGMLHDDARRIARALAERGLRVENADVGEHPDWVDRDGDRWWECAPGRYAIDPLPGRPASPAETATHAKPTPLATVRHLHGPLIAVPRLSGRGSVANGVEP